MCYIKDNFKKNYMYSTDYIMKILKNPSCLVMYKNVMKAKINVNFSYFYI